MTGIKRIGIAALLIAPVMAFALPAQASAPSVGLAISAPAAKLPATVIKGTKAVYSPTKLSAKAKWNGTAACVASLESFTIANTTTATQTVTDAGQVLGSLPPNTMAGICINKSQVGIPQVFGLSSNKKAKLTVTVK
jgi:hypothetical protein